MTEYSSAIFYKMLDTMRKRPGMWLGTPDITKLRTYIDGYLHAVHDLENKNAKPQTTLFPLDFKFMHEFARIKTGSYGSAAGWANLILEECGGDERAALERFFEYLDEFRSLKAVSMKKAVLREDNILANDNMLYSYRVDVLQDISPQDIADDDDRYVRHGELIGIKSPIYDSPKAVYLIGLSGSSGFICAVETASEVRLINYIFRSQQIIADKRACESPEHVFGKINTFAEADCAENPDFGKPVC